MIFKRSLILLVASLLLTGCPAAIIGGGAVAIDTTADRRTHGVILEDSNIELKSFALIQKIEGDIHTNVTSYNGHVLIVGQVPSMEIKTKIASSIRALPNVKSLSDELTIGPVASLSVRAQDTLITSNVKARFFKENKVVYLMGILNKEEAKEAETIAKNTSQVSKVVTLFEVIPTQK